MKWLLCISTAFLCWSCDKASFASQEDKKSAIEDLRRAYKEKKAWRENANYSTATPADQVDYNNALTKYEKALEHAKKLDPEAVNELIVQFIIEEREHRKATGSTY